jgi:hypothetical protein
MKKLQKRGQRLILPIVGDTVSEVVLSTCRMPAVVFRDADGNESEIHFEEAITLARGDSESVLHGSRPGVTFNPCELSPLVELLGTLVTEAIASEDGSLRVTLSNEQVLSVLPSSGYEAWHFQYPRGGRPVSGDITQYLSVTGDDGRLITSGKTTDL